MAKQKLINNAPTQEPIVTGEPTAPEPVRKKLLAKAFHMAIGVDLIGSKTSMAASKTMELEVTPLGIKCASKNSGRLVLIPWPNIKGVELYPET